MARIGSVMALGLLLALPLGASAAEKTELKGEQVAAVSTAPSETSVKSEKTEKSSERPERRSMLRGSTHGDPVTRFNNPYAFPLQTLPLAVPNVTTFSF